ncbi:MAG: NUDIX hydrolase [Acidimicrobiales bacterium]
MARSTIDGVSGADATVQRHRRQMLRFIDTHPDAAHRSCAVGHLTGSALVIEEGTDRLLLLFHRKLQRWLQPGGHADGDANLAAVALREAIEETGIEDLAIDPTPIDLDVHRVAPPGEPPHDHLDVRYLVMAPGGSFPAGNHESEALRWVARDELGSLDVDPGMMRMARAGIERLRLWRGHDGGAAMRLPTEG